jgi:hypothetical protein
MLPQSSRYLYFDILRTLPVILILQPGHYTPSSIPPSHQIFLSRPFSFSFPTCAFPLTREAFLGPMSACGSQSQSYVTTDGQSVSLPWCQAPTWGSRPDCYYCQTLDDFFIWGALSDERTGMSFTIAAGLAGGVILGSESLGTHDHILLFQIRDSPNLEGQIPHIYVSQEQGGPVIPPGIGFSFRRLLRLAGLRWGYSNPPPSGGIWLSRYFGSYVLYHIVPRLSSFNPASGGSRFLRNLSTYLSSYEHMGFLLIDFPSYTTIFVPSNMDTLIFFCQHGRIQKHLTRLSTCKPNCMVQCHSWEVGTQLVNKFSMFMVPESSSHSQNPSTGQLNLYLQYCNPLLGNDR